MCCAQLSDTPLCTLQVVVHHEVCSVLLWFWLHNFAQWGYNVSNTLSDTLIVSFTTSLWQLSRSPSNAGQSACPELGSAAVNLTPRRAWPASLWELAVTAGWSGPSRCQLQSLAAPFVADITLIRVTGHQIHLPLAALAGWPVTRGLVT